MTTCKGDNQKGFTLIEMIGVLAIMAIMAGMLAPGLIQQLEYAQQGVEEGNLERLAAGLEAYILTNRRIPPSAMGDGAGGDTWDDDIREQVLLPINRIANANNGDGCKRRYWFDPDTSLPGLSTGDPYIQADVTDEDSVGTPGYGIPEKIPVVYTLSGTLVDKSPTKVRAMIISDLSGNCANSIGAPNGVADFQSAWAQNGVLTESPKLKIQRMNFSQLFEPVALLNRSSTQFIRVPYGNFTDISPGVWVDILTNLPAGAKVMSYSVNGGINGSSTSSTTPDGECYMFHFGGRDISGTDFQIGKRIAGDGTTGGDPEKLPYNWGLGPSAELTSLRVRTHVNNSAACSLTGIITLNGYFDITVTYKAPASWQLFGQAGDAISIVPGVNPTIYVINGTQLFLCEGEGGPGKNCQAETGGVSQLASLFIKESDSFVFSPGPPAIWGR